MPRRLLALLLLACLTVHADDKFQHPGPVRLTKDGEKWADKTLHKLSLEEKIGQMLMVRAIVEFRNVESPEFQQLAAQIRRFHLGSVLLPIPSENGFVFRNQPYEAAMLVNELQRQADVPLIVAGVFNPGRPGPLQGGAPCPCALAV